MVLERSDHPLPAVGDSMKIDALKRREFITLCAVGWPLGAAAQQVKKIRRIGWLGMSTAADAALDLYAFRRGLRDLGHVDGQGSGEPDLMGGRSLGQSGNRRHDCAGTSSSAAMEVAYAWPCIWQPSFAELEEFAMNPRC